MKKPGIRTNKTNYRNGAGFISALFKKNTGLKNSAGLTLIELLVVVAIMMIMAAIVIVNYRPGNQQLALNRSASKLAQDIRRAQEMAMSSAEVGGSVPPGVGIVLRFAPGIWKDKYRIYADNSSNERFHGAGPTPDFIIETINMESGVIIEGIRVQSTASNLVWGSINFRPPDPAINIFGCNVQAENCPNPQSFSGETWMRITLTLESDPSQTKTVRVNNAGLIYVEQN